MHCLSRNTTVVVIIIATVVITVLLYKSYPTTYVVLSSSDVSDKVSIIGRVSYTALLKACASIKMLIKLI